MCATASDTCWWSKSKCQKGRGKVYSEAQSEEEQWETGIHTDATGGINGVLDVQDVGGNVGQWKYGRRQPSKCVNGWKEHGGHQEIWWWNEATASFVSDSGQAEELMQIFFFSSRHKRNGNVMGVRREFTATQLYQKFHFKNASIAKWLWRSIKVMKIAAIQYSTYHFLLVVCSNYDSILHRFHNITTCTVYLTACDLQISEVLQFQ